MPAEALIVQGGWEGHYPEAKADKYKDILREANFSVEVSDSPDYFEDESVLGGLDLIIPVWSMGSGDSEKFVDPIVEAVEDGAGIAGAHGGMCDAFRRNIEWQFMTGGQWVAHPGGDNVDYEVNIKRSSSSPIVEGIKDFQLNSEQYYLHVDPAVEVLATTSFSSDRGPHRTNGKVEMPVIWTKRWGRGRVFYCSLGHGPAIVSSSPVRELMRRGFLWAAGEEGRI